MIKAGSLVDLTAYREDAARMTMLFVGSYTERLPHAPYAEGEGIYRLSFDPASGQLGEPELAARCQNPSFLARHTDGQSLYAVSEVDSGVVLAYRIGPGGTLDFTGRQTTLGSTPAHLSVDARAGVLLAANYVSGAAVVVIAVQQGGTLGEVLASAFHHPQQRPGIDPLRQGSPHPHQVLPTPDGSAACVTDLGTDELTLSSLAAGSLLRPVSCLQLAAGSGPRHLRFGPPGLAFLALELHSEVLSLRFEAEKGELSLLSAASTLPPGFTGQNAPAEVLVSPDGQQVYVTNRGHDSVAVFEAEAGGRLRPIQHVPTDGRTPRGAAWSPDGGHLICANQDSSSITVFRRDPADGHLQTVGTFPCPTPTSIV